MSFKNISFGCTRDGGSLLAAVRGEMLNEVRSIIEEDKVDVDFQEGEGTTTALMIAADRGHAKIVQYLLDAKAEVNTQDKEGRTALTFAVINNHLECVKLFMDRGADPDLRTMNGWSAAFFAANKGLLHVVQALLYKQFGTTNVFRGNLNLESKNSIGGTVLMLASMRGHVDIVRELLSWGADIDGTDQLNWTALMKAADKGHSDVVRLLMIRGAEVTYSDKSGFTALHLAAKAGQTKTVNMLLAYPETKAILNKQDANQRTALFYAAWNGHLKTVKALLKGGADASVVDKSNKTAYEVAKDPTGRMQKLFKNTSLSVSEETHQDILRDAVPAYNSAASNADNVDTSESSSRKRQKTQDFRSAAQFSSQVGSAPLPTEFLPPVSSITSVPTMTPSEEKRPLKEQRKRARSEMTSDKERQIRASLFNAYYTAAWCGDRVAFDRLRAAKNCPLAKGFVSLLMLSTRQYKNEAAGTQLAASCVPLLQKEQQDNPHAHFVLAVLQHTGVAMAQNVSSAVVTLLRLSHQGHANAQCFLARHYADTTNGLLNPEVQSLRWYTRAAAQDHPEALYHLGRHHLSHPDHDTDEDKATGATYLSRAAARGHPAALQHLGDCHRHAVGVARDEDRAFLEYKESSEKNDLFGTVRLAECYAMDVGGQKDDNKAAKLYKKAAEEGHIGACYHAGMNHFNGTFEMERDDGLALQYLLRVVTHSAGSECDDASIVAKAEYVLGLHALHGLGTVEDPELAAQFFEDACDKGHLMARIELALHLAMNVATEESKAEATALLNDINAELGPEASHAFILPLQHREPREHLGVQVRAVHLSRHNGVDEEPDPHTDGGLRDRRFFATDQWLQDSSPFLKVGILHQALYPSELLAYTPADLRSSLRLLNSPLRQAGRTVICVCESEKAIEDACNALDSTDDYVQIRATEKRRLSWEGLRKVAARLEF